MAKLCTGASCALLLAAYPAAAQDTSTDAGATLLQPLVIASSGPLEFGVVAIPATGTCTYVIGTAGEALGAGGACQWLGGDRYPANFTINCAGGAQVQFELTYTDEAPEGAHFSAPEKAMDVDGAGPAGTFQARPCDADGTSEISAAGQLDVEAGTASGFSGRVGTIRLEVAYE